MVFKLVRTDTEDPCKIQLPVGVHIFGRGVFLDCEDKRVSRKHGQLEVTTDTVTLRALHQNPCFFIRKGLEEKEILRQENIASLSNGDKFGLLPNSYWYELLHCTLSPSIQSEAPQPVTNGIDQNGQTTGDGQDNLVQPEAIATSVGEVAHEELNESELLDFQLNETIDNLERPESPSLMTNDQAPRNEQGTCSQTQNYKVDDPSPVSATPKRAHSTEEPGGGDLLLKKVKTEPDDASASASDGNVVAPFQGPSNPDQAVKDEPPSSPVKPAANNNTAPASRERCWYGAQCYRRNPQHKAEFSHPADSDWGAVGERAPCPRGAGCQKRDPRHHRDHDHPAPAAPGAPCPHHQRQPGNQQVVYRNGHIFYINAHSVNFYDDHFHVEDSDGDSVDYDYEF